MNLALALATAAAGVQKQTPGAAAQLSELAEQALPVFVTAPKPAALPQPQVMISSAWLALAVADPVAAVGDGKPAARALVPIFVVLGPPALDTQVMLWAEELESNPPTLAEVMGPVQQALEGAGAAIGGAAGGLLESLLLPLAAPVAALLLARLLWKNTR